MSNPLPLVLFHASCMDGFTSAWAAKRRLGEIEAVAVTYGEPPPDVTGRDVYVLDFSYPRHVLLEMHARAASILVLDHHKTAQAALEGLPWCKFDMTKSGARMTWEHFHHREVPGLVRYVEDRDLWKSELPDSKAVNACLRTIPFDFAEWDVLGELSTIQLVHRFAAGGQAILRYQSRAVADLAKKAHQVEIAGYTGIPCINATGLTSELGEVLAVGHPFAVVWFQTADKQVFSLRSGPDGADVSEVAGRFGGGGHKHAAGFTLPLIYSQCIAAVLEAGLRR